MAEQNNENRIFQSVNILRAGNINDGVKEFKFQVASNIETVLFKTATLRPNPLVSKSPSPN